MRITGLDGRCNGHVMGLEMVVVDTILIEWARCGHSLGSNPALCTLLS
jgi:hypothetical protein